MIKESGTKIEIYLGRKFRTLDTAVRLSRGKNIKRKKSAGGQEKRKINEIVARNGGDGFKWGTVGDLFGGVGFATWAFSLNAERVIAIEKNKEAFENLKMNLSVSDYNDTAVENATALHRDNIEFLHEAIANKVPPPSLVDLDPFGGCDEQLCLVLDWMTNGALLVTDGRIEGIYRNSFIVRRHFPELDGRYTGKSAVRWPEEFVIPRMHKFAKERNKIIRVIHFYAHPNSSRYIIEVGNFQFSTAAKVEFHRRSKFIDWFAREKDRTSGGFFTDNMRTDYPARKLNK
jgi:predicted RNA methylase